MKPTELMIGDWVLKDMNYSEDDPMYTRPDYQPYQIQDGEDIDLACETNCIGDTSVYQPIPLTEELLTRNFPDPSEIVWFPLDEYNGFFNIYWEHPSFGEGEVRLNIQYVHQLQHVLRLCGIEKKVEL